MKCLDYYEPCCRSCFLHRVIKLMRKTYFSDIPLKCSEAFKVLKQLKVLKVKEILDFNLYCKFRSIWTRFGNIISKTEN